jgi:hypothetical protein
MRLANLGTLARLGVIFAAAAVIAALLLYFRSWRERAEQEGGMRRLAAERGWEYLGSNAAGLPQALKEVDPDKDWRPQSVILVEGPPHRIYLFYYESGASSRREKPEPAAACLAGRSAGPAEEVVVIDPHASPASRLVFRLMGWLVSAAGGPEIERDFLVRSRRPEGAAAAVTSGVREVLRSQPSGVKWSRVWISGKCVLVTAASRLKTAEWDELLDLTKRLRAALPH